MQQWKEEMLSSLSASARARQKLKWMDNEEEKTKLVTNKSDDDLINREDGHVQPIFSHKKAFIGKTILKKKYQTD